MEMEALVSRVRSEFIEMPGLRLTVPQAMRLWGLERASCQRGQRVVDLLVDAAFLQWGSRADSQATQRSFYARA
jgi:hypothetical protein